MQSKVSLIATVYNEAASIGRLLSSIISLTRFPDECIFVDAGSSDGTIDIINDFVKDHPWVVLKVVPGVNIARGRNIVIEKARYDIIAITDGGARLDTTWLSNLVVPLEEDDSTDVVAGWTVMEPHSRFEKWVSLIQRQPETLDMQNYLPSARSLALRKEVWVAAGKFPENLKRWAEDSAFMVQVRKIGLKVKLVPEAKVYWRPRGSLRSFWTQYVHYGYGDGEARLFSFTYIKRIVLLCSVLTFLVGIFFNWFVAAVSGFVTAIGFFRLMLPLRSPTLSVWKLIPLYVLVLFSEAAKTAGYVWATSRSIK